jgi:superfamily II DNA/RNA helicase
MLRLHPTVVKVMSASSATKSKLYMSDIAFGSHPLLKPKFKEALATMKLVQMTEIQAKTFEPAYKGEDVLGRARTGSGKFSWTGQHCGKRH